MEIKNIDELKDLMKICKDNLTQEVENNICMMWFHIGRKEKIQAIKYYRIASGKRLLESKLYVNTLYSRYN